jgi:hypothetical protein
MTFPSLVRTLNRVLVSLMALCLSGSACSGPTSGSVSTTGFASTPVSTGTTTNDGLIELEVSTDPLPPGTYWSNNLDPIVTFTISEDWQAVDEEPGMLEVSRELGTSDLVTMQFANVTGVYNGEGGVIQPADAAEASRILGSNPDLTVLGTSSSLMDGREGVVVEMENSAQTVIELLRVPSGVLAIDEDHRLWMALFDDERGVLAVMVGSPATHWEEALLAAEPLLESVTIGT